MTATRGGRCAWRRTVRAAATGCPSCKGTHLHPEIIRSRVADNWSATVGSPSPDRFSPFLVSRDWKKTYGGAPYIAATENFVLLSWQETTDFTHDVLHTSVVRVAAVPKSEIADGRFTTMRVLSVPSLFRNAKESTLWNSLCPLEGDSFLLVSQSRNRIIVHPCHLLYFLHQGKMECEGG